MTWYNKSDDLMTILRTLFPEKHMPWDDYYLRMAQSDFLEGNHDKRATKSFFIRSAPFGGSYALLGGLTAFIRTLEDLKFTEEYRTPLKDQGYSDEFIDYLIEKETLKLRVYSIPEGGLFFPHEPAIVLEGDLLSIRIAEGSLLPCVNFPTLSMTKWSRVNAAAAPGKVLEFARRRSQDDERTTLYAFLAGTSFTSNSEVCRAIESNPVGTMGHEYVQSHGDELSAFDAWLTHNPDRPVLLVDTLDTLESGIVNAVKAFKDHWSMITEAEGSPAIRLDSGDLAYLTIECRNYLDRNGLEDVKIILTNDLDEHSIEEIKSTIFCSVNMSDSSRIFKSLIWACGTKPGNCYGQPSLGGVAKLGAIENDLGVFKSVMKLAKDNPIKSSIPGFNFSSHIQNYRQIRNCLIYGSDENLEEITSGIEPNSRDVTLYDSSLKNGERQKLVYDSYSQNGDLDMEIFAPTATGVMAEVKKGLASLSWDSKLLENPQSIQLNLSSKLFELKHKMVLNNTIQEM